MSSTDLRLASESPYASHSRSFSLGGSQVLPPVPSDMPPIRPLDLAPLMHSHELTHAELARTVDELQQWMSVVEVGLAQMLDRTTQDTIEEETEDVVVFEPNGLHDDSFSTADARTATPSSFALPYTQLKLLETHLSGCVDNRDQLPQVSADESVV